MKEYSVFHWTCFDFLFFSTTFEIDISQGFLHCSANNVSKKIFYLLHCVKSARIRSYSGPHLPAFGLNTERYVVSLRIQSECGKMRTTLFTQCELLSFRTIFVFHALIWFFNLSSIATTFKTVSRTNTSEKQRKFRMKLSLDNTSLLPTYAVLSYYVFCIVCVHFYIFIYFSFFIVLVFSICFPL